jgi:FAD dependent oxidoreductase
MEISNQNAAPRVYDLICFGDEVPGLLAVVAAAREFRRRTGKFPKTLVMFKGTSSEGVGGHLVRGGLGYLDRTHAPADERAKLKLPTFGDPCALYKEFLTRSGVNQIALDPRKADTALRQMLSEIGADIISRAAIEAVDKNGDRITSLTLNSGASFSANQFIDCTVNAELAQLSGVPKYQGFGTFGLPDSELPTGMIFETEGINFPRLQQVELSYLKRFTNPADAEAQRFIHWQ